MPSVCACSCNKRKLTYITAGSYFFLIGVEYAIIIPTLNLYLASMNASSVYVGFCLSAMSLTGLVSAPIYGRITDVTRNTKIAVLASNVFAIAGNFSYACSKSASMVIVSRLVVGVAAGSTSAVLSMISRSTTKEERTGTLSQIFVGRQAGMIIGPAFNLFLKNCNFNIASLHVGPYTSPGYLMAVLWFLETILVIFFYYDLDAPDPVSIRSINSGWSVDDDVLASEEKEEINDENIISSTKSTKKRTFLSYLYTDLLTEEIVLFMAITFVIMFVQVGMEALVTPLSKTYFNWGEVDNSIYYSVSGALFVLSLVAISFASKKISDRKLIVAGLICLTVNSFSFVILMIFVGYVPLGHPTWWMYFLFIFFGVVQGLTMAIAWVPVMSMITKFTSEENQGFTQGVRLIFTGLGKILGPLWLGSLPDNLVLSTSVNLALYLLVLGMFIASYKRIAFRETLLEEASASRKNNAIKKTDEKSPLLRKRQNPAV